MGDIHNRKDLKEFRHGLRRHATAAEAVLWPCLKASELDGRKFRRQHSVGTFILDFYCPSERLCIEVDGGIHDNPTAAMNDRSRDEFLASMKIQVLRFSNDEVLSATTNVVERIRMAFKKT